jgi:G3E family GTPase
MNPPIEVLLLTGYLGAGKTTALRHLLQLPEIASRSPALLVNEFGDVGVDGRWFDDRRYPLFEINRGSLFCICTQADLLAALREIAQLQPGLVLVEATGVAETCDLELILDQPDLAQRLRVRANICLVDALNFTKVAPFLQAARKQVAAADALVINKVDLAPPQTLAPLEELLRQMNPRAVCVRTTRGKIPFSFLDPLQHQRTRDALAIAQPESIYARSFTSRQPINRDEFLHAVNLLGSRLLRLKGHVAFADRPQPDFVESVGGEIIIRPALDPRQGTAFTAIAFGLPDDQLQRAFGFVARADEP